MSSLKHLTLLWLICTSLAMSAGGAEVSSRKVGRIIVLGDSLTAGYGIEPTRAYPALLQEKVRVAGLAFEVVNAGVSGDTTAGGLRRIDWALSQGAEVLIIALGGNDGLRGIAPSETAANLTAIIQRARAKVPKLTIVLAAIRMPENLGAEFLTVFSAVFPQVASEQDAVLIPDLLAGVAGVSTLNQADLIHPTADGQKRICENVWKVLEPLLVWKQK